MADVFAQFTSTPLKLKAAAAEHAKPSPWNSTAKYTPSKRPLEVSVMTSTAKPTPSKRPLEDSVLSYTTPLKHSRVTSSGTPRVPPSSARKVATPSTIGRQGRSSSAQINARPRAAAKEGAGPAVETRGGVQPPRPVDLVATAPRENPNLVTSLRTTRPAVATRPTRSQPSRITRRTLPKGPPPPPPIQASTSFKRRPPPTTPSTDHSSQHKRPSQPLPSVQPSSTSFRSSTDHTATSKPSFPRHRAPSSLTQRTSKPSISSRLVQSKLPPPPLSATRFPSEAATTRPALTRKTTLAAKQASGHAMSMRQRRQPSTTSQATTANKNRSGFLLKPDVPATTPPAVVSPHQPRSRGSVLEQLGPPPPACDTVSPNPILPAATTALRSSPTTRTLGSSSTSTTTSTTTTIPLSQVEVEQFQADLVASNTVAGRVFASCWAHGLDLSVFPWQLHLFMPLVDCERLCSHSPPTNGPTNEPTNEPTTTRRRKAVSFQFYDLSVVELQYIGERGTTQRIETILYQCERVANKLSKLSPSQLHHIQSTLLQVSNHPSELRAAAAYFGRVMQNPPALVLNHISQLSNSLARHYLRVIFLYFDDRLAEDKTSTVTLPRHYAHQDLGAAIHRALADRFLYRTSQTTPQERYYYATSVEFLYRAIRLVQHTTKDAYLTSLVRKLQIVCVRLVQWDCIDEAHLFPLASVSSFETLLRNELTNVDMKKVRREYVVPCSPMKSLALPDQESTPLKEKYRSASSCFECKETWNDLATTVQCAACVKRFHLKYYQLTTN
ncbi:hypothetical protein, variant [Aphanomyces astaci]|uniref:Uncharacterized protein n=1 Tax=Aphanomyces astaci TaxID=112090 RepID=W4GQF0_APHAT|nr:hypothetical protein, variant [Aphanomyces astaci]ETV81970.1 hypothetical protein, variant [Aphanomyces astaci]|eukprot:XP_009828707.1 hypothetical protein, variant [Aphanomyces astaci]